MLIQDLEDNIYAIGGRKVEYKELTKNQYKYFHFSIKDMSPADFFYRYSADIEVAEEWTYLFYHIPTSTIEKQKLEYSSNSFKEVIVCCITDDGENDIYTESFYPEYLSQEKKEQISNAIHSKKTKIETIEQNIALLGGSKIDFKEISKNIQKYIQYYHPWMHGIYCKNSYNRIKDMTDKELIYYLSEKDFLDEYTFQWYHIPFTRADRTKDTMFLYENDKKLSGYDKNFVGVKEILVVTGTDNDKDLEYFKIFFPFDMLEEKQKEIKEFILHSKK